MNLPLRLVALIPVAAVSTHAANIALSIRGTDAIWLAGRTDLVIPAYSGTDPVGWIIDRHDFGTPEGLPETFPSFVSVVGGDVVRVADPAIGGVSFFNGIGGLMYGPEGNPGSSSLSEIGGISGYLGTEGALVGVFLDDGVPSAGPAPARLDFSTSASRDFAVLSPALGQVFFIGDGLNSLLDFQEFVAPAGATRLFFGVPDGFGFDGVPGAYDDNDGGYRIQVAINDTPIIPEGQTYLAAAFLALGIGTWSWRRRVA